MIPGLIALHLIPLSAYSSAVDRVNDSNAAFDMLYTDEPTAAREAAMLVMLMIVPDFFGSIKRKAIRVSRKAPRTLTAKT